MKHLKILTLFSVGLVDKFAPPFSVAFIVLFIVFVVVLGTLHKAYLKLVSLGHCLKNIFCSKQITCVCNCPKNIK